jgi:hypothetical protein
LSILLISLTPYVFDCIICDEHVEQSSTAPSYGVARYEDEVVPDFYQGEWGGSPVCDRCYWIERGMHAKEPTIFIPFSRIRKVSKG